MANLDSATLVSHFEISDVKFESDMRLECCVCNVPDGAEYERSLWIKLDLDRGS